MAMARFRHRIEPFCHPTSNRSHVKDIKEKGDSRTCCCDLLGLLGNIVCIPVVTSWFSGALESFKGAEVGWGIPGRRTEGRYWSLLD